MKINLTYFRLNNRKLNAHFVKMVFGALEDRAINALTANC